MTLKVELLGNVHGVGLRKLLYKRAVNLNLSGYVTNKPKSVYLEATGDYDELSELLHEALFGDEYARIDNSIVTIDRNNLHRDGFSII